MANDDWPDWLPGEWSVNIKKIDGRKVKCYIDPTGHKCYSKPQVLEYLKRTNRSAPVDETQNVDDLGIDLSVEPNGPHMDEVPQSSAGGHPAKLTPRSSSRKPISGDLSEDFLAGEGSSSAHLSLKRHRGDTSWLPAGWTVEEKVRKGGSSSGMKYKMYTDPTRGHRFFSKPQVMNYLAKINSSTGGQEAVFPEPISAMPISAWQEKATTEPDNSQTYEATEAEEKTEKKTESSPLSSGYEVISRTPAEGLPAGWIKEVRMRRNGVARRTDPYFLDPLSDYAFCSKKDALRYLESGDIKTCVSKHRLKDMFNDDTKPLRSITGGSFATPDTTRKEARPINTGSFSTPKEDSDWLPEGWLVYVRYKNSGAKYKIYKEPATGKLFYSKPQLMSHLGHPISSNSRKRKEHDAGSFRKKRSHRKKDVSEPPELRQPVRWSVEENNHLVRAWLEISEDPEASNFMSCGVFYTKVYETFVALVGKDKTYRHADKVSAYWRYMNNQMQNFQGIYNRVRGSNWSSGKNDADIQREALAQYQVANNGLSFNHLSCWEIVRNHPKWRENPTKPTPRQRVAANRTTKQLKTDSSSIPGTPTDAQNFNLVDDDDEVEVNLSSNNDYVELGRPPGRQSAKDKRGKGLSRPHVLKALLSTLPRASPVSPKRPVI